MGMMAELSELKSSLKKFEEDKWKLIVFKKNYTANKEGISLFVFESIFYFKKKEKVSITINVNFEKKVIELSHHSKLSEELLVEATKLTQKIYQMLLKEELHDVRLKVVTGEYKVQEGIWLIDLEKYESKWEKEDVFSLKDDIEDLVNKTWAENSWGKDEVRGFYLIGETGKHLKELLCEEMMLMKEQREENNIFHLIMNDKLFTQGITNRAAGLIRKFIEEKGIITL